MRNFINATIANWMVVCRDFAGMVGRDEVRVLATEPRIYARATALCRRALAGLKADFKSALGSARSGGTFSCAARQAHWHPQPHLRLQASRA